MVKEHNTAVIIKGESDIIVVRGKARDLAIRAGFGITDVTRIVTAASELARNIVLYGTEGQMSWSEYNGGPKVGLELVFVDEGPGISDVSLALKPGYTTSGGLGMGLPGTKRLMDEMLISSITGAGTRIVVRKWLRLR